MKVDFHVHSTASDGTFTPTQIMGMAKDFRAIALTDHDNCDGFPEFKGVPGVELSIDPGKGFDKFHLLGLGIDYRHEGLRTFLRQVLKWRNERNERIFANFHRLGIDIKPDPHGEVLARPHFAKWLHENGYTSSVPEAFDKYLASDAPEATRCYETRHHPAQLDAIDIIHQAGGIAIMAHPKYWKDDWKLSGPDYELAEKELARLKEMGLDGLEALYEANTIEENIQFTRIADRLGLLKSAGSDFHGTTKPTIALGMEVPESFISPLLSRLSV